MTVRSTLISFAVAAAVNAPPLLAQPPGGKPVFTVAQAESGKKHYDTTCSPCHGTDMGGADAPGLAGGDFAKAWSTQTTSDLFKYVQGMPPGGTPLPDDANLTVVAYILQQNGAVAGASPLLATTAVKIGDIATGKRPPLAVAVAVSHRR